MMTEGCDEQAVIARGYWQRGRYIAVTSATLLESMREQADLWIARSIALRIYENLLSDVLRREIRNG